MTAATLPPPTNTSTMERSTRTRTSTAFAPLGNVKLCDQSSRGGKYPWGERLHRCRPGIFAPEMAPRAVVATGQPVFSSEALSVHRQFLPSVTVKALQVWHSGSLSQLCWQNSIDGTVASPVSEPPGRLTFGIKRLRFTSLLPAHGAGIGGDTPGGGGGGWWMPPLAVQLPAAVQLIVTIAELSVEALLASEFRRSPRLFDLNKGTQ